MDTLSRKKYCLVGCMDSTHSTEKIVGCMYGFNPFRACLEHWKIFLFLYFSCEIELINVKFLHDSCVPNRPSIGRRETSVCFDTFTILHTSYMNRNRLSEYIDLKRIMVS